MALGKKIALLTTVGVVLAVIVFGFLSLRAVNQATEAMLQDRLTTAGVVADYLDESLGRAVGELQRTAQMIDGVTVTSQLGGEVAGLQDTYQRLLVYVRGIYLVDARGGVVWSQAGAPVIKGEDMSFYPSINETIARGQPLVSALVRAPVTESPVVLLTSPTRESYGVRGVLLAAIDLSQSSIGGFVKPIRLGQTGYVEIVDQNGVVVARTEPGPKLAPFEKSDHSGRFAALIAAGKPTQGLCHTCHEPVQRVERWDVLAFVPLSSAHWGVAIRQSEQEAMTPIVQLRQNLILFGAGLIALALLLVAITTRDVVSRVRMITTASEKIAGGDLVSPVVSARQDEIGELARSFEDMRVRLQREDQVHGELLREILSIQEEERRRIARELHDETSQVLASLNANLQAMSEMLPEGDDMRARLKQAQALSISVLDDIHRLIYELRPTLLDDLGLVAAARWLADNNLRSAGIKVNFRTMGREKRLPSQVEGTLFRVIQEAVNNIARHARAASADISLRFKKGSIAVCIEDDGTGFDVEEAIRSKDRPRGLGLLGMKERVELVNGTLNIESRSGGGTKIDIEIPCNGEPSGENKVSARGGLDNGQD